MYSPSDEDFFSKLSSSTTSNDSILTSLQDQDESSDIFDDQIKLWTKGTSIEAQEETRKDTHINYSDVEQYIIQDFCILLSRISEKADRLLGNNTTNLAESWMHIRCKFEEESCITYVIEVHGMGGSAFRTEDTLKKVTDLDQTVKNTDIKIDQILERLAETNTSKTAKQALLLRFQLRFR
ncbi:unnamed protein product [Mytilus edulis]|uniref:Uncharacterized protein n=1 Tax=Mytilus edulis TaxID=6550 RepID=A0A8S3U176_MYTED|nr:unnamed protein product [Mytilus edulis]